MPKPACRWILASFLAVPAVAQADSSLTLPSGTVFRVRLEDGLRSSEARVGDAFRATVVAPISLDGRVLVPAETVVEGQVTVVKSGREGVPSGVLGLAFVRLTLPARAPVDIVGVPNRFRSQKAPQRASAVGQSTGRKTPVIFIGTESEEVDRVSSVVGRKGQAVEKLAAEWAATGMSPADADLAAGAEMTFELTRSVSLPR